MAGIVVTGTDTGVGKTFFACLLLKALREAGAEAVGFKPVCCGERADAERLVEAGGGEVPIDVVNPVWYRSPVAPAVAAELEGRPLRLEEMISRAEHLAKSYEWVILEGVGGWEVPLTEKRTFADLAGTLGWPVAVVAANRLGALNHTLLTAGAVQKRGLTLAALVLNHLEEQHDVAMVTNRAVLEKWLDVPVRIELMPGQDWLEEQVVTDLRTELGAADRRRDEG